MKAPLINVVNSIDAGQGEQCEIGLSTGAGRRADES